MREICKLQVRLSKIKARINSALDALEEVRQIASELEKSTRPMAEAQPELPSEANMAQLLRGIELFNRRGRGYLTATGKPNGHGLYEHQSMVFPDGARKMSKQKLYAMVNDAITRGLLVKTHVTSALELTPAGRKACAMDEEA